MNYYKREERIKIRINENITRITYLMNYTYKKKKKEYKIKNTKQESGNFYENLQNVFLRPSSELSERKNFICFRMSLMGNTYIRDDALKMQDWRPKSVSFVVYSISRLSFL